MNNGMSLISEMLIAPYSSNTDSSTSKISEKYTIRFFIPYFVISLIISNNLYICE